MSRALQQSLRQFHGTVMHPTSQVTAGYLASCTSSPFRSSAPSKQSTSEMGGVWCNACNGPSFPSPAKSCLERLFQKAVAVFEALVARDFPAETASLSGTSSYFTRASPDLAGALLQAVLQHCRRQGFQLGPACDQRPSSRVRARSPSTMGPRPRTTSKLMPIAGMGVRMSEKTCKDIRRVSSMHSSENSGKRQ